MQFSFKQFLLESVEPNALPSLLSALEIDPRSKSRFLGYIDLMNKGLLEGEIANPIYQDMKMNFNRAIEYAHKKISSKHYGREKWDLLPQELQDLGWTHIQIHTVNSTIKKLQKITHKEHALYQETEAFLKEIKPLSDAMEQLKGMVFKGKKKSETESKPAFEPSPAAREDIRRVSELLMEITQKVKQEQLEGIKKGMRYHLDSFMKAYGEREDLRKSYNPVGTFFSKDPYYSSVVSALTTRNNRMEPYTVRPDAETIMEKRAEEEAGFMQQKFVAKNTRKLAPIISAKGSMADAKVLHANGHGGSISGTMYVSFQDGSKFIVDNSIVIGASKYGLRFYRYPTTFHDVYLANGERMPQPSEEKMHKIFAGIDTPVEPDEETPVENVPVGESFRRMLQLI